MKNPYLEAPAGLEEKVIKAVRAVKIAKVRRGLFAGYAGFAVGVLAFVPAFLKLYTAFVQSGFFQTLSLAFTDAGAVSHFISDFVVSLAESLPSVEIVLTLAVLVVIAVTLRVILIDRKKIREFSFAY